MGSLYVCLFSNGVIKVGQSVRPQERIKSHVDRVGCVGVTLEDSSVYECVGHLDSAESALISRCGRHAERQFSREWFSGLDYQTVSAWASEFSRADLRVPAKSVLRAYLNSLPKRGSLAFAKECGVNPIYLNQLANGRRQVSAVLCCAIERITNGAVTRQALRPDDWQDIWPEFGTVPLSDLYASTDIPKGVP